MMLAYLLRKYLPLKEVCCNLYRFRSTPIYSSRQERIAKLEQKRKHLEMSFVAFIVILMLIATFHIRTVELPFINTVGILLIRSRNSTDNTSNCIFKSVVKVGRHLAFGFNLMGHYFE